MAAKQSMIMGSEALFKTTELIQNAGPTHVEFTQFNTHSRSSRFQLEVDYMCTADTLLLHVSLPSIYFLICLFSRRDPKKLANSVQSHQQTHSHHSSAHTQVSPTPRHTVETRVSEKEHLTLFRSRSFTAASKAPLD